MLRVLLNMWHKSDEGSCSTCPTDRVRFDSVPLGVEDVTVDSTEMVEARTSLQKRLPPCVTFVPRTYRSSVPGTA